MQTSGSGPMSPDALEFELRRSLLRFDCPDAQTLGEYDLNLVDPVEHTRIAAHVVECDECTAELRMLREFLAMPISVRAPLVSRARRLVATLFTPRPGLAYGGLRGVHDASTRVYEVGDVTITLGPGQRSGSLFGLVVAGDTLPERLEAANVRLVAADASVRLTQLDDLGNFELAEIPSGVYVLEIELADAVVVIEALQVD